jgi:HK97 gp10 family phage protein
MANAYPIRFEVRFNKFPKLAATFPQDAADVQGRIVLEVHEVADESTPVGETGNLKSDVVENTGSVGVPGYVHWLAPYCGFVHNGTRYMSARPFIAEAVKQVQPNFEAAIKDLLKV